MANVTSGNFESILKETVQPVLVDFWASWCAPCRSIAPHLETLAEEFKGNLKVLKVNVDEDSSLAQKYSVRSIPTLVILREGREIRRKVGASSLDDLREFVRADVESFSSEETEI